MVKSAKALPCCTSKPQGQLPVQQNYHSGREDRQNPATQARRSIGSTNQTATTVPLQDPHLALRGFLFSSVRGQVCWTFASTCHAKRGGTSSGPATAGVEPIKS